MATPAPAETNWREQMTREDRIKVCQHIMAKLSSTLCMGLCAFLELVMCFANLMLFFRLLSDGS